MSQELFKGGFVEVDHTDAFPMISELGDMFMLAPDGINCLVTNYFHFNKVIRHLLTADSKSSWCMAQAK